MKKILLVLGFSFILISGGITAYASEMGTTTSEPAVEDSVELEADAGIKPGSIFYGLDKSLEKLRLFFASEGKKQELLLKFAKERLAELNELDEEGLEKFGDSLYEQYGVNLEKVSEKLAEKIANGDVDKTIEKIKEKLDRAAEIEKAVSSDKVEAISDNVKKKIKEVQTKTYAVNIVTDIDTEQVDALKELGYGYGEILKLQAFAE